jgi:hypothetical protein
MTNTPTDFAAEARRYIAGRAVRRRRWRLAREHRAFMRALEAEGEEIAAAADAAGHWRIVRP